MPVNRLSRCVPKASRIEPVISFIFSLSMVE
jgi:hypothetical protein